MTQLEMINILKTYLEAKIPAALTTATLPQFEKFLPTYPSNPEQRQLACYLAEGFESASDYDEAFLVQAQLAKTTDPAPYLSAMWPVFLAFDPKELGFINKSLSHICWYPGEPGTNGSTSIIYIEMKFDKPKDDCED